MARLESAARANLPDSAFAYVDSRGNRRLPINDAAHVRNALARFNQVVFEDEEARERGRTRLLKAAKKYGIVPVGFIAGQLNSERELGRRSSREPVMLPSGFVTLMLTDIEGSTALLQRLGDDYGELLDGVRTLLKDAVLASRGHVVDTRADEFFAVFEPPAAALEAAVSVQRALRERAWVNDLEVRVRVGIHSGYPTIRADNYIGMAVHTAARICDAAHGGQVLVSGDARTAARGSTPDGVRFRSLGSSRLRGLPDEVAIYQLAAKGLMSRFPALRISRS
jgi:class 3 adenylate cyclase